MSPRRSVAALCLLLSTVFASAQSPPNYYLQKRTGDTGPMSTQKVSGAASKIWGTDASGVLGGFTIGSGLNLSGGTLTSSGSGGTWGSITGTLSAQTDLQAALDGKAAASHTQAWSTITSTPTTLEGYGITDAQGLDAELTALAGLTSEADALPYFTGSGTASTTTLTSFARALLDDADVATARLTLQLGPSHEPEFAGLLLNGLGNDLQLTSGVYTNQLSTAGLTGNRVSYLPNVSGTLISSGDSGTVTNTMLAGSIDLTSKVTGTLGVANGGTGGTSLPTPTHYTAAAATVSGHLSGIDTAIGNAIDSGLASVPVFNVMSDAYGADGTARDVSDGAITNGDATVTSATANFTADDVGNEIWGMVAGSLVFGPTTIASINSTSSVEVASAPSATWTGVRMIIGVKDTTALQNAMAAAKAAHGVVEVPPGGYIVDELPFDANESAVSPAVKVRGAGSKVTRIYLHPSYDFGSTTSNTGIIWRANGNCRDAELSGLTVDGATVTLSGSGYHLISDSGDRTRIVDVRLNEVSGLTSGASLTGTFFHATDFTVYGMGYVGVICSGGGYQFDHCLTSNCGYIGLQISSISGTSNLGAHFRWIGGMIDECGGPACLVDSSSTDVAFDSTRMFGFDGQYALHVSGNSTARVVNSEIVAYTTGDNRGGLKVDSGSTAYIASCRLDGTGTAYGLLNAGTVYDGGNNTIDSVSGNAPVADFANRNITTSGNVTGTYVYAASGGAFVSLTDSSVYGAGLIRLNTDTYIQRTAANAVSLWDGAANYGTLRSILRMEGSAPSTASDTGSAGELRYDGSYLYICTGTNTWKRVAIATW